MGNIQINPAVAQAQATKLANAATSLTVNASVSYSSDTTISGNEKAKESTEKVSQGLTHMQNALQRDINNIHSIVASFVQADQTIANEMKQLSDPLSVGKK